MPTDTGHKYKSNLSEKDDLQNMLLQQLDINRTKKKKILNLSLTSYTKLAQNESDFHVKYDTIKEVETNSRQKSSGFRQRVLRLDTKSNIYKRKQ